MWTRPNGVAFGAVREEIKSFGFDDGADPSIGRDLLRVAGVEVRRIEGYDFVRPFQLWNQHPARRSYFDQRFKSRTLEALDCGHKS